MRWILCVLFLAGCATAPGNDDGSAACAVITDDGACLMEPAPETLRDTGPDRRALDAAIRTARSAVINPPR